MFGGVGLVSMVEGYVEEEIHRHMVVVDDNHIEVHHNHWIGMHLGMTIAHSTLVEVVATEVDQMLEAPPTFDCPILDASLHCSSYFLQHSCNHTHSQSGENS
ncbi:hypothetical protein AHAS_Ahas18G0148300 [Arachis hypogaea]